MEVHLDGDGVKFAKIAEGQSTIPHYLDYPVKSRRDWEERYKPRLAPDTPGRFPDPDWDAVRRAFDASGKPVCLYLDSYIGYLRNLMGFEAFSMLPYDDLDLFEEMVETLTVIKERLLDRCGFHGGIQKKALAEGKDAIDQELRRVLPAVRRGGYIPHLDHACPANVPLENYQHYMKMKREILGCGGGEKLAAKTKQPGKYTHEFKRTCLQRRPVSALRPRADPLRGRELDQSPQHADGPS